MPTTKQKKVPVASKPFSLVSADAQQKMFDAVKTMKVTEASGAEIAEIAVCLCVGAADPVIAACAAGGAKKVRKTKTAGKRGGRVTGATLTAVEALLGNEKATAVVCVGKVAKGEDFRSAFQFAARHKLPILYVLANRITPKGKQEMDLRTLYAEFGIPVFSVDANDAIAAYRVATEALHNARHHRGPCVIEALTLPGKSAGALELLQGYMERHGNWPA